MKPFNLTIIVTLILITVCFIFFKDGLYRKPAILMDRLNYLTYSEQNLQKAQKTGKPILFFAATVWCQTCQALENKRMGLLKMASNHP